MFGLDRAATTGSSRVPRRLDGPIGFRVENGSASPSVLIGKKSSRTLFGPVPEGLERRFEFGFELAG